VVGHLISPVYVSVNIFLAKPSAIFAARTLCRTAEHGHLIRASVLLVLAVAVGACAGFGVDHASPK
jgi:hypothetical protein